MLVVEKVKVLEQSPLLLHLVWSSKLWSFIRKLNAKTKRNYSKKLSLPETFFVTIMNRIGTHNFLVKTISSLCTIVENKSTWCSADYFKNIYLKCIVYCKMHENIVPEENISFYSIMYKMYLKK